MRVVYFQHINNSPTKHITFISLTVIAIFFSSCSSGNSGQQHTADSTTIAPAYDNSLPKGKVIDSVTCNNQPSQTYALYLPSYYSSDKQFPCIYLFDAHARGALPVKLYKNLAEQYGFILIGSNISKNGTAWQETLDGVTALTADVRARLNIDSQRVYTAGFSGGSRVAGSVAIVNGGIAGVIGCSAGLPVTQHGVQSRFDYFGIVGVYDFNLAEMEKLDQTLAQDGTTHQLLTYNGKHDWPSAADFQTAMLWMQLNAMKENRQPKTDSLIKSFRQDFDTRIAAAKTSGEWIRTNSLLEGTIRLLTGLDDVSAYRKQIADITAGNDLKNAIALQDKLQAEESTSQQELKTDFTGHDEKWWTAKIKELNQKVHSAKTKQEAQMNQRLLNYLGLIGYLNSSSAINNGDFANAAAYLKFFKMADPKNADCPYLTAIYYMKKGDAKEAITALNEAAALGYSEVATLNAEPAFSSLHDNPAFKAVLEKVSKN